MGFPQCETLYSKKWQKDAPVVGVRQVSSNQDPPAHVQGILEDVGYIQSTVKIPKCLQCKHRIASRHRLLLDHSSC